jgi:hypothetical protein
MPKRVDSNQAEIVQALRDFGCTVQCLHMVGRGCPDILVGYNPRHIPGCGMNLLLEVKVGDAKLTKDEQKWHDNWAGEVIITRTPGHAIEIVRLAFITRYCKAITGMGELP